MGPKGKTNGRRSPFKRDLRSGRLVLQERDNAIIRSVYEYGIMTGEQIEKLMGFGCATRRNVRLRTLFDHGYLGRRFLTTLQGSARALYVLGPESADIVTQTLGVDPETVRRQMNQARKSKDFFLRHHLQVNDVRLAVTIALGRDPDMNLDFWRSETELPGCRLVSDAYCRYSERERLWSFFLELDRSTETHRKFKNKVETYLRFGLSGAYAESFGLKYFRVLIVTLTEVRLMNLKRLVESVTDKMFWFAVHKDIEAETVFGKIWRRSGRDGTFPLKEA